MATAAQQVDLNPMAFAGANLTLLGLISIAPGAGRFVGGAHNLYYGHHPEIAVAVQATRERGSRKPSESCASSCACRRLSSPSYRLISRTFPSQTAVSLAGRHDILRAELAETFRLRSIVIEVCL